MDAAALFLDRLGPVGWPLLLCSVAALALAAERLAFFLRLGRGKPPGATVQGLVARVQGADGEALLARLVSGSGPLARGTAVLLAHRDRPRAEREEVVSLWLREHAAAAHANLRLLHLVAVVAPLLGLLGTVFGMILVFRRISDHAGPVNPALLADGLWQAMSTTAVGLCIAIPALVATHGFRLWATRHVERLALVLSHLSLALDRRAPQSEPHREAAE